MNGYHFCLMVSGAICSSAVIYPQIDGTYMMNGATPTLRDGAGTTYDQVEYEYYRSCEVHESKDQNEMVAFLTSHDAAIGGTVVKQIIVSS